MLTHPFNAKSCRKRLLEELNRYKSLYIGLDFDNTIYDFHHKGGNYQQVIDLLKKCSDLGHKIILCSCETNPLRLKEKVNYCKAMGISIFAVNSNPEVLTGSHKPYYSILLDDRAGLEEAYNTLKYAIENQA